MTALDSGDKAEMLRSIGADRVMDYTREDFTQGGEIYDAIFDAPGKSSYAACQKALKQKGQYFTANPGASDQLRSMYKLMTGRRQAEADYATRRKRDLIAVRDLIEAGKIKAVVDKSFPFEQTAEAHRYAETGRKKGNLVISVATPT